MKSNSSYSRNSLRRSWGVVGKSVPIFLNPQRPVRFPFKTERRDARQVFTNTYLQHMPIEPRTDVRSYLPHLWCGKTDPKAAREVSPSISRRNPSTGRMAL